MKNPLIVYKVDGSCQIGMLYEETVWGIAIHPYNTRTKRLEENIAHVFPWTSVDHIRLYTDNLDISLQEVESIAYGKKLAT